MLRQPRPPSSMPQPVDPDKGCCCDACCGCCGGWEMLKQRVKNFCCCCCCVPPPAPPAELPEISVDVSPAVEVAACGCCGGWAVIKRKIKNFFCCCCLPPPAPPAELPEISVEVLPAVEVAACGCCGGWAVIKRKIKNFFCCCCAPLPAPPDLQIPEVSEAVSPEFVEVMTVAAPTVNDTFDQTAERHVVLTVQYNKARSGGAGGRMCTLQYCFPQHAERAVDILIIRQRAQQFVCRPSYVNAHKYEVLLKGGLSACLNLRQMVAHARIDMSCCRLMCTEVHRGHQGNA